MERDAAKKKRRHIGLRFKFIVGIILFAFLIGFVIVALGANIYSLSIQSRYTDMAYKIADTAIGFTSDEEIARYADAAERSVNGEIGQEELDKIADEARYKEIKAEINNLRSSMNANDVFLCVVDYDILTHYDAELDAKDEWLPLCYIMDCYYEEEYDFPLGGRSPILTDYIDILVEACETGAHPEAFIVSDTENFGNITTAVQPVVQDGKTIAFCFVEIPMSTLRTDLNNFIRSLSVAAGIATLLLLSVAVLIIIKSMIQPIVTISNEAESFTKNNRVISDKLDKIKTKDEIQNLSEKFLEMEVGINEYIDNLQIVTAEKERIGAELNVAAQIQSDMLPNVAKEFKDNERFDIFASMTPAKEVGGDFYDAFMVDKDHIAMVMADVSGKGVPAALFMVIAKTLIKNRALLGGTPAEVLKYVNEQLCEGNEAELFVTVWLAILDLKTGKGIAANAGHEHPAIMRKDGKFELVIYRHSPAVATLEGLRFREHEFELYPGDKLFVYTDGVPEATNADNKLFGAERMVEALNKSCDRDVSAVLSQVKTDIDSFVGDAPQFDDITMLGFEYYGDKTDEG